MGFSIVKDKVIRTKASFRGYRLPLSLFQRGEPGATYPTTVSVTCTDVPDFATLVQNTDLLSWAADVKT